MDKIAKRVLIGIVIAVVLIVLLVVFTLKSSDKYVCKSDEGSITIYYKDGKITGYTGKGYTYDLDEQQDIAERIGIDTYLEEFNTWFVTNSTNGKCEKK
jgi:hypothetical protein